MKKYFYQIDSSVIDDNNIVENENDLHIEQPNHFILCPDYPNSLPDIVLLKQQQKYLNTYLNNKYNNFVKSGYIYSSEIKINIGNGYFQQLKDLLAFCNLLNLNDSNNVDFIDYDDNNQTTTFLVFKNIMTNAGLALQEKLVAFLNFQKAIKNSSTLEELANIENQMNNIFNGDQ